MNNRFKLIVLLVLVLMLTVEARLAYLQLLPNAYKEEAVLNALTKEYITPPRGFIYDRKGRLLASNQPVYSVWITPSATRPFDTVRLAALLQMNVNELRRKIRRAYRYSRIKASMIANGYLKNDIAGFMALRHEFPGFSVQRGHMRKYHTAHAANVLGYLQEAGPALVSKDPFYRQGDWVGVAGLEKYYEKILRGRKGVRYFERDKYNRITRPYANGRRDTAAVPGKDLHISIDIDLQAFIDTLMQGKHGAVVVLDPATGEVLSLVTAPSYDPELLTRRDRNKFIGRWLKDKVNKPLFDRSLLGTYPPGSPFKLVNALVGQQTGAIRPWTTYVCHHGFRYGNRFMRCHCGRNGPVNLAYAIPYSCNTYFSKTYLQIINSYGSAPLGQQKWAEAVGRFGLGHYLGYDLPVGSKGNIPDSSYYHHYFGHRRWKAMNIISNGIGQGQVLVTPIQLANMAAAIANRGWYYTPHFVREIQDTVLPARFRTKHFTGIDSMYFAPVIRGMREVFTKGTARYSEVPGLDICGKTGTSQNFIRRDGKKIPLPDHSIFVAFAPMHHPRIVVSVFIENGGYGATLAGPIAALIIEKYLRGHITRTDLLEWVRKADLTDIYQMKADAPKP